MNTVSLSHCRVVLVRPSIAANLGAVARVMRNFGLSDLRLVAPHADPGDREARRLSTQGEGILASARSVADLGDAVADSVLVIGTTARLGGLIRRQVIDEAGMVMSQAVAALASGPVALVFGPEQNGLTNAEVTRCHDIITIDTDEGYPTLNLAQCVAICLYELRQAWRKQAGRGKPAAAPPAPFELQERMYLQLEQALRELHFLWGEKAEPLMHALRHLLGRARPSEEEVGLLMGLARQIRWYVRHYGSGGRLSEDASGPAGPG